MEDEDTANEGVMIGADLVEAARQIEEETAKALESLADGGAMMALGQLRSLVEMSQNHPEAHVELIEDDPPELLARANRGHPRWFARSPSRSARSIHG